jgi:hypothetical protein
MEAVIARGNARLSRERIGELRGAVSSLVEGSSDDVFARYALAAPEDLEVLRRFWPEGVRAVFRAALYSAIERQPEPIPVTVAWAPAYDYDITVSEARGTTGTTMTILRRGPYEKVPSSESSQS